MTRKMTIAGLWEMSGQAERGQAGTASSEADLSSGRTSSLSGELR
jgi:hypothetical protein